MLDLIRRILQRFLRGEGGVRFIGPGARRKERAQREGLCIFRHLVQLLDILQDLFELPGKQLDFLCLQLEVRELCNLQNDIGSNVQGILSESVIIYGDR